MKLRQRSFIVRYGVALALVALAVAARRELGPALSDRHPFPTFYVSLTVAAWWGGLGPALFALALGYLAADWFFIAPRNAFSSLNLADTGTYFLVGLAIVFFTEMMHRAQDRAEASAAEARDRREELEREADGRRRVEREREGLFDALRTERARLEAVLRQMPAGVVIVEAPTGAVVLANEQSRRIWRRPLTAASDPGYGADELRGKNGQPYLPHEWPLVRSMVHGEVVRNEEVRCPRGGGDWGAVSVSSVPIRDQAGTIVAAVAVLDDITARRQADEELARARAELERRVAERTADLARANQSLRAEVTERRNVELARNALLQRLVVIQEEERVRIARELHDQMGQQLTALKLGLEALDRPLPEGVDRRERLVRLLALTRGIGHDMHRIAWELGPAALDEAGLPSAVSNYAEEWSGHAGVRAKLQCIGPWDRRLPPQVETTLYRVVQEALTNVAKHAAASRVSLILSRDATEVRVVVEDDGVGFDPESGIDPARPRHRLGLLGMKERVQAVGGELQVESATDGGTSLFVRVPLRDGKPGPRP